MNSIFDRIDLNHMILNYNISFSIASLIINVILVLVVSLFYSSKNLVNKRFKYFLISTIVLIALDIVTALSNDNAHVIPAWANVILNSLYFFSGAIVGLLFFYYIVSVALKDTSEKKRQIFYIVNVACLGVYLITLIVNAFTGIYFDFEGGSYNHGSIYLLVNAFSIGFVVEAFVIFIIKRRKFKLNQIVATVLFIALFFGSFGLQIGVFPEVLLSDFGVAIGTLLIFFTLETPDYIKLMATLKELNDLKASLETQVRNRTRELRHEKKAYEELTLETLSSLALLVDAKDHYTNGHSFRVAAYAKAMANSLEFSDIDKEQLYFAGLIHDVGKVGIPEAILRKPGKLTPEEYEQIKAHPRLGGDILKGIKQFPIFEQVARSHHERYDGTGYPDGLKGEEIPLNARIVTICDTFDAMTSDRSYRKALSDKVALEELIRYKGTQFDPYLVDIFIDLYNSYPDSIRNHVDELAK